MIGETTLAMLYVPLLFYIFDLLSETFKAKKEAKSGEKALAEGSTVKDASQGTTEEN